MIARYLIPILIFIPVAVIQVTLVPYIAYEHIAPDLVIILLVYLALREGQVFGTVAGAAFGIVYDLVSGGYPGLSMFSMTIAGFVAGYFYNDTKNLMEDEPFKLVFVVLLAGFLNSLIYSVIALREIFANTGVLLFEFALLPAVYTAVVSMVVVLLTPVRRMF